MNLVQLYLERNVFPLHKILTWKFEQRIEKETVPVYNFGSHELISIDLESRRAARELKIIFSNLSNLEKKLIYDMKHHGKPIENIKLTSDKSTIYLHKGYIKSFDQEAYTIMPYHNRYMLTVECTEVVISADPPVTGFEPQIRIYS